MNEPNVPPIASDVLDNLQQAPQAAQHPGQGGNDGNPAQTAPAPAQPERWQRIPAALRERPQWLLAGPNDKGELKVPMGLNGPGSSTNRSTWLTFDQAASAAQARGWGIGYVLSADDPFACIDLDVKDDTTPEQMERFRSIENHLASYSELSQSGRGLHVWVLGKIGAGLKRDRVEVYSQERFISCTGNVYRDAPIEDRQDMLTNMVSQMRGQEHPTASGMVELPEDADDWHVLLRAVSASNAEKFCKLWQGQWQEDYTSQSEADFALLSLLEDWQGFM